MSEMSERARSKAKAKVERLTTDPHHKVDASSWTPPEPMHPDVKTGMRPVSRRQYKKGGKVMGEKAPMHAGRKPRKSGGSLTANSLVNRDVKEANEDRAGTKFVGGMKKGGRAHKMGGGMMMGRPELQGMGGGPAMGGGSGPTRGVMPARPGMRPMMRKSGGKAEKCGGGGAYADGGKVKSEFAANKALAATPPKGMGGTDYFAHVARSGTGTKKPNLPMPKKDGGALTGGTRPAGGRMARAKGGRAKKGMNVNIIIAPGGGAKPPMPMPMTPPPGGPVGLHQGAPPPPMAPPGAAPPMGPPPMARKRGGRAYPIDSGAGGGLGRLEKARAYG
jgi:hypothetical protein